MKKKLDIFNIPFHGVHFIEASAGTGKTNTIVSLYLRAILGLGNQEKINNISVNNILVVTFTNAAKEELYTRIKNNIEELYISCIHRNSANPIFQLFLKKITNLDEAIRKLDQARRNINNACIYTIHGFCQDVLQSNNIILDKKIIDNEDFLYLQATQDFWRSYFYHLPKDIIKIVLQYYKNPESLLNELKPTFSIDLVQFKKKFTKNETILTLHQKNINEINNFKAQWLQKKTLLNMLYQLKINKKIYNVFNISRWLNIITNWSKSDTQDYSIPTCLKYFLKDNIEKNIENTIVKNDFLKNIFFYEIKEFLKKKFSLKNIILFHAEKKIKYFLKKEKEKKSILGFDDLLKILLKNIKKENFLTNFIIKNYPITFIDEFQDTSIEQYKIFNHLYKTDNKKKVLFLIGDPKQSIYGFRGADIFSYLYAKSKIKNYYYLNVNWRSSKNICDGINYLFEKCKNPFILKNIFFEKIISSDKEKNMQFQIKGVNQTAIQFFCPKNPQINLEDYHNWIAKQCANQIKFWLIYSQKGEAVIITKNNEKKVVTANDIVILVKNKNEAKIIQTALKKVNITSIYSSSKKSVFHTFDAYELLWILQTLLEPTNVKLLKQSITTHIFNKILLKNQTKQLLKKEISYIIIEKIYQYKKMWENIGIFYTIKNMILEYQSHANNFELYTNCQKNINFLHMAELLSEKSEKFYQKSFLIRWLEKKIFDKKIPQDDEAIRYFKKPNVIKIITIYKSKGLEYPIVWIPFSINYSCSKTAMYHNLKNSKIFFDNNQNHTSIQKSDIERLSEDIRCLYVSLTRAIYHISLGIGYIINTKKKYNNYSEIHNSALGYVIQNGQQMNYKNFSYELNALNLTSFIDVKYETNNIRIKNTKKIIYFLSKPQFLLKKEKNIFQITSFTKIKKSSNDVSSYPQIHEYINKHFIKKENQKFTIHDFPRGTKTGILMHDILKKINFCSSLDPNFFEKMLQKYYFSKKWKNILIQWVYKIIHVRLNNINISLSSLKEKQYIKEFEFFLPIQNILCSQKLNKIIESTNYIDSSKKIFFNPITGILTGFIDLIFILNEKYYILDYKSNYLGDHDKYYSPEEMEKEIIKNKYNLQYQLYTVAVHVYLTKKVKKYHYNNHFGGIFYMFLRGIHQRSIFYTYPEYALVKKLTKIFSICN